MGCGMDKLISTVWPLTCSTCNRADYLDRGLTPHLLDISKKGLRAKFMKPVFPVCSAYLWTMVLLTNPHSDFNISVRFHVLLSHACNTWLCNRNHWSLMQVISLLCDAVTYCDMIKDWSICRVAWDRCKCASVPVIFEPTITDSFHAEFLGSQHWNGISL